jgi:hypothetical protein
MPTSPFATVSVGVVDPEATVNELDILTLPVN